MHLSAHNTPGAEPIGAAAAPPGKGSKRWLSGGAIPEAGPKLPMGIVEPMSGTPPINAGAPIMGGAPIIGAPITGGAPIIGGAPAIGAPIPGIAGMPPLPPGEQPVTFLAVYLFFCAFHSNVNCTGFPAISVVPSERQVLCT
jgi:hypothetical protein